MCYITCASETKHCPSPSPMLPPDNSAVISVLTSQSPVVTPYPATLIHSEIRPGKVDVRSSICHIMPPNSLCVGIRRENECTLACIFPLCALKILFFHCVYVCAHKCSASIWQVLWSWYYRQL